MVNLGDKENFGYFFEIESSTSSNCSKASKEELSSESYRLLSFITNELFSWSSDKSLISYVLSIASTNRERQNAIAIKMICFILL
jgi:hypothetical protein